MAKKGRGWAAGWWMEGVLNGVSVCLDEVGDGKGDRLVDTRREGNRISRRDDSNTDNDTMQKSPGRGMADDKTHCTPFSCMNTNTITYCSSLVHMGSARTQQHRLGVRSEARDQFISMKS